MALVPRVTGYRDPWADDAPCQRCGKNVHLPHNPPCPHGHVACPECDWHTVCADCNTIGEVPC